MSQKRIRSINWDEEEKQLFRAVFKEYAQIIENKNLDTNTNKMKVKAWGECHNKFYLLNRRPRELSQLKIQWKSMKIVARKTFSTFQREVNKTGGGARPPTPDSVVLEIKDLLNPSELLRDNNVYDSDGVMDAIVFPTANNTPNIACIEMIEDDDQVPCQNLNPVVISQVQSASDHKATPMEKIKTNFISVKTPVDKTTAPTLINKSTTPAKKVPKRKINLNHIMNGGTNSKKDHEDYVSKMLRHSKMLKDEEHMRRMEMMEEEHSIKMEVQKEKLKAAILEREILELKKQCALHKIQSSPSHLID